ncbi:hypothetical protein WJX81_002445 [Elliptochloris bilobata]|uniref:Protein kinase domain-containing protein n=1 Tax=Elliptochloris bilobata TaxID=381761 RepID=A0AAW1R1I9_9CHLO
MEDVKGEMKDAKASGQERRTRGARHADKKTANASQLQRVRTAAMQAERDAFNAGWEQGRAKLEAQHAQDALARDLRDQPAQQGHGARERALRQGFEAGRDRLEAKLEFAGWRTRMERAAPGGAAWPGYGTASRRCPTCQWRKFMGTGSWGGAAAGSVLHLDVKGENVLVFDKGNGLEAKLGDWGHAVFVGADSTVVQPGWGTPAFRAPEMEGAAPVASAAADVFSVGAMVYDLLLLRPTADKARVEVGPELGVWGPVVEACTRLDPAQRCTLHELATYLAHYAAELGGCGAASPSGTLYPTWDPVAAGGAQSSEGPQPSSVIWSAMAQLAERATYTAAAVVAMFFLAAAPAAAITTNAPAVGDGWYRGRGTFYGGPESFLSNFGDRGPAPEYGFGNILFPSCGYFNQQGTGAVSYSNEIFPRDAVAALANNDPDYPGSCGRCYEIRCHTGPVIANGTSVYRTDGGYNMFARAPNALDEFGRRFPGNPLMSEREAYVRCWNNTDGTAPTHFITITDNCPCVQYSGAEGSGSANQTGTNPPCCGDIYHFDLSYWAFQNLAHPLYGIMMLDFRPVDCSTRRALTFLPGFINNTVYGDRVETGWAWFPYRQSATQFWAGGQGLGGSNATCLTLDGNGGGLTFACRSCAAASNSPFASASALQLWVRSTSGGGSSAVVPPLRVSIGDYDNKRYCSSVTLQSLTPTQTRGAYSQFSIPLSSFNCPFPVSQASQIGIENADGSSSSFCLDNIVLSNGAASS